MKLVILMSMMTIAEVLSKLEDRAGNMLNRLEKYNINNKYDEQN